MKKGMKRRFCILLAFTLAVTLCFGAVGNASAASYSGTEKIFEKTGDYLYQTVKEPAYGAIGGEWTMYGLAEAGYEMSDSYIQTYKKSVETAVEKGKGVLHSRKYTEYSRVILAYTALGLDPTNIKGYSMVEKLADFDSVVWQGVNGPIFALQALDAGNYQIPKVEGIKNLTTRQKLIDYILKEQLADGGWALTGGKADPDLTGMALTALAPYYKQSKVKKAIDKAVNRLSYLQEKNGGFESWGTSNLESCAQVLNGLLSVGINPNTDSRFKKSGNSVLDGMMDFYDETSGGFRHVNQPSGGYTPVVNVMATEQAYYALAHFFQIVPSQSSLSTVTSPKKGTLKATWKKDTAVSGYQVKIARNSGFSKSVKNYYISGNKNNSKTMSGLTKGKKYYVKVRAYTQINGKKVYGLYSPTKSITVK